MTTDAPPADAVFETDLPLPGRRQGKVRDIYTLPPAAGEPPKVLIVATDRVSAFDVVMPTPVPGKGAMLTDISVRWFDFVRKLGVIDDHLLATEPDAIEGLDDGHRRQLQGRMMLGRAAKVVPVECVVRGYVAGSGWADYTKTGCVCGHTLPEGLQRCDKLPASIFTPATKADVGHDENIDFDQSCDIAGRDVMERLRDVSITIYEAAAKHAEARGIILADTKFEFGFALDASGAPTDELILIDEVLTPDSSRFWPLDDYEPGREQHSFDKQYVRNHLQELVDAGKWDKTPPGPELPPEIVRNTLARYEEARKRLFA
jgi:phosphoribosylaminoimidazole-succinocarboxamide synthase